MKKLIIILCIVLVLAMLVPIPMRMKDGGTVVYNAVLYRVEKVHRLSSDAPDGYIDGTIVRILGIEVCNNVEQTY